MLPFLSVFGHSVPMYGLCIVFGTAMGIFLLSRPYFRYGFAADDMVYASLFAVIGAMIGSKALYLVTMVPQLVQFRAEIAAEPMMLFNLFQGGFVFCGGLIGGAVGAWLYCRRYHLDSLGYFDRAVVVLPLAHAFGRIGCFCAGCCYGIPYEGIGSVTFPPGAYGLSGVALFPVQLLEAFLNGLLFLFLIAFCRKKRGRGVLTGAYLAVYAILRFLLEFLRYDGLRGAFLWLSTSQWISVVLLLFAVFLLLRGRKTEV